MGDIADMMLDGTLCQMCGEFMGSEGDGFPIVCGGCQATQDVDEFGISLDEPTPQKTKKPKVSCQICGKKVKKIGLGQHLKDVHG